MLKVSNIQFDYLNEPQGVEKLPKISWKIKSDKYNISQKKYCIQISYDNHFEQLIYDSGVVISSQSTQIKIVELEILNGRKYFVRIRITSNTDDVSDWAESFFITGIVDKNEWKAQFITAESSESKNISKGTYVRGSFFITKPVEEAISFTSALGVYKAYLNGKRVSKDELSPGWTSYKNRLLYQTNDVTKNIKLGENVFAASVGAGWYKGKMGFLDKRNNYGEVTAFIGQILVRYKDNSEEWFYTNESYKGNDSPIIFSEIYDGEIYDSRKEIADWNNVGTDLKAWHGVKKVNWNFDTLTTQPGSRVKKIESLKVKAILQTPKGENVIDFGQNLTGWLEFSYKGEPGEKVEFQFFETLDKDGNVYTDNLRSAKQKISYICKDTNRFTYQPSFTFQGFRYVHIKKYTGAIESENFIAHVVHSEMERTGFFSTSNKDLNRLFENIKWSMKDNFLDVPTDCPQRNERCGWTGDVQIFCQTALYLMNSYQFMSKWLKDVAADQTIDGGVPHVVPDIISGNEKDDWLLSQGTHSAAGWADVAIIAPWAMYLTYGDKEILSQQYRSMKLWIDFMRNNAVNNIWNYKLQFGDWLALDAKEGSYFGATPNDLTCTAFYANSTLLFSKIAGVLNEHQVAKEYHELFESIKKSFQNKFFNKNGELTVQTQTAHILVLKFNLAPKELEKSVAKRLVYLLKANDGKLTTGFLGTPYFCQVLSDYGYTKEAYDLLLRTEFPSWLYQIKHGATTIWEHWDGIKPDGTMWSPDMNSFNHYAYGSIGEWLFKVVLGINVDENCPGFKNIVIEPKVDSRLKNVKGKYNSIYGDIVVSWKYINKKINLEVIIPPNTTASIRLKNVKNVLNNNIAVKIEQENFEIKVKSGKYTFTYEEIVK